MIDHFALRMFAMALVIAAYFGFFWLMSRRMDHAMQCIQVKE